MCGTCFFVWAALASLVVPSPALLLAGEPQVAVPPYEEEAPEAHPIRRAAPPVAASLAAAGFSYAAWRAARRVPGGQRARTLRRQHAKADAKPRPLRRRRATGNAALEAWYACLDRPVGQATGAQILQGMQAFHQVLASLDAGYAVAYRAWQDAEKSLYATQKGFFDTLAAYTECALVGSPGVHRAYDHSMKARNSYYRGVWEDFKDVWEPTYDRFWQAFQRTWGPYKARREAYEKARLARDEALRRCSQDPQVQQAFAAYFPDQQQLERVWEAVRAYLADTDFASIAYHQACVDFEHATLVYTDELTKYVPYQKVYGQYWILNMLYQHRKKPERILRARKAYREATRAYYRAANVYAQVSVEQATAETAAREAAYKRALGAYRKEKSVWQQLLRKGAMPKALHEAYVAAYKACCRATGNPVTFEKDQLSKQVFLEFLSDYDETEEAYEAALYFYRQMAASYARDQAKARRDCLASWQEALGAWRDGAAPAA